MNYDDNLWHEIVTELERDHESIHTLNRAQLIDDMFNLVKSNHNNASVLMELIKYVKNETDYYPLYSLFQGLNFMEPLVRNSEAYANFKVNFFCDNLFK